MLERGARMAAAAEAEGRPEAGLISQQLAELEEAWRGLQEEMRRRRERLNGSNLAQQYYNDADEAEAWIGEQELYMIADEKAKVRSGSRNQTREEQSRAAAASTQRSTSAAPPSLIWFAFERGSFYSELSGILFLRACVCVFFSPCFVPLPLGSLQDEQSAMLMLKRHMILKQDVDDYTDSIQKLSGRAQKMLAEEHPDGWVTLAVCVRTCVCV